MLKDIIEERQRIARENWIDTSSSLELDKQIAETAQIVAREVLRKVREGVEDYKVGKEMTRINTTGADYIYVYDLKHFVLQSLEEELESKK
jgi:hypothetical protein